MCLEDVVFSSSVSQESFSPSRCVHLTNITSKVIIVQARASCHKC